MKQVYQDPGDIAQDYFKLVEANFSLLVILEKKNQTQLSPDALKESYCKNFAMHSIDHGCFDGNFANFQNIDFRTSLDKYN